MENINIQIEPEKLHFSDGCAENVPGADEVDLLRGEPCCETPEPVILLYFIYNILTESMLNKIKIQML